MFDSLSQYCELIEVRYAVGFGPQAGLASLNKGLIVGLEKPFVVEEDGECAVLEHDFQGVP